MPDPQEYAVPFRVRAYVVLLPAEMEAKVNPPTMGTGIGLDLLPATPIWPESLSPQQ